MAESLSDASECLSITPYQFEPTHMDDNGDSEDSKSDFDDDQASFTDRLGHTSGALAPNVLLCLEQWNAFAAKSWKLRASDWKGLNQLALLKWSNLRSFV